MENPQEFLDRNLEELKALQIGEVKVIDGVRLVGNADTFGCDDCFFSTCQVNCDKITDNCINKSFNFAFVEVDENGLTLEDLKNEMELNSLENE